MQLWDVAQSRILPKHIILATTHAILVRFSSKWAQNVRIFKEYHVGNRLQPVQVGLFALFEKHATATAGLVLIGPVQFGFRSFFGPMDRTFKH